VADVVVTVPKALWAEWLEEGDLADGQEPAEWEAAFEYGMHLATRARPKIEPGERVYVVAHGQLRGYAPLVALEEDATRFGGRPDGFALVRRGGAVAVTLADGIRGFQGWRYRWWERSDEIPFPNWRQEDGVPPHPGQLAIGGARG